MGRISNSVPGFGLIKFRASYFFLNVYFWKKWFFPFNLNIQRKKLQLDMLMEIWIQIRWSGCSHRLRIRLKFWSGSALHGPAVHVLTRSWESCAWWGRRPRDGWRSRCRGPPRSGPYPRSRTPVQLILYFTDHSFSVKGICLNASKPYQCNGWTSKQYTMMDPRFVLQKSIKRLG